MPSDPFSSLTTYESLHLVAHLSELRQFDALHRLIWLEDDAGRSAWFEFKQAKNASASYLNDLSLAWSAAEANADPALAARYMLASASWVSQASSLHPRMFPALVRHGLWSKERALAAAMNTTLFRPQALGLLSPLLDEATHDLVFATVLDDLKRAGSSLQMDLQEIGGMLPEDAVRTVLSWPPVMWMHGVPVHDSAAQLLPRLAELGHATEAWRAAEALPESPARYIAQCGIAGFLPKAEGLTLLDRLGSEFKGTDKIEPDASLARALALGLAALGEPELARTAALRDAWAGTRDLTLDSVVLAFARAGDVEEARRCADLIQWSHKKARTLARMASLIPADDRPDILSHALELARETWKGQVEALRIEALATVGASLSEPLRSQVLEEALEAALSSGDAFARGSAVASIADLLTDSLLARGLAQLQVIGDGRSAIVALAAHRDVSSVHAPIDSECLRIIAGMKDPLDRWVSARTLLTGAEGASRAAILSCAVSAAAAMTDSDWSRRDALTLPHAAEDDWAAMMLDVVRQRPATRPHVVPALASFVRGAPWHEIFDLARALEEDDDRASTFEALLAHADNDGLDAIAQLLQDIGNPRASERLRASLARRLATAGRPEEGLVFARQIQRSVEQLDALSHVAGSLAEPDDALIELIEGLNSLRYRPMELNVQSLTRALPAPARVSFLIAVRDWAMRIGVNDRERICSEIAGPLAEAGLEDEAIICARAVTRPGERIGALTAICAALPEGAARDVVAQEAWDLTTAAEPGLARASMLETLLPALRGELRERAISTIELEPLSQEIPRAVAELVPLLLPQRTADLLAIALEKQEVLAALVSATADAPLADVQRHWQAVTRAAGRRPRKDALERLGSIAPWTRRVDSEAAATGIPHSVALVRRCFP